MCVNISPLLGSVVFALFGVHLFVKAQRRDSSLTPKDDGGTPSWLFYLFCANILFI